MEKSQIDPAKITEFEYNINRILKLMRDRDMDGTPEELAELVQDVYNQYILYRDHPEGNNLGLQNQISEFEKKSKEREEELSASKGPKTEIEEKVKRILKLIKDGSLVMDGTPEEILKREPLAEFVKDIESITDELNLLQNKVESLQHQNSDLEAQSVEKIHENSKLTTQNQSMKEEFDKKNEEIEILKLKLEISTVDKKNSEAKERLFDFFKEANDSISREKVKVEEQLRASKRELNTLKQKASDYENQISANKNEIGQLARENLEQEDKLGKLEKELSARKLECSALQRKLNAAAKDASGKITAFTAKVDNLQKECEKIREEREKLREENNELAIKVMDLQRTLNEDYNKVDSWFNECKVQFEVSNRKIEEITEELRKWIASKNQMVDDLKHQAEDLKRNLEKKGNETRTLLENVGNHEEKRRLLNQKLRNTEQLLSEKEESFRKVEEELQQVRGKFHERMEAIMKLMKGGRRPEEVDESER